jgi:transcriptional regulator with XRE-family HTH domain
MNASAKLKILAKKMSQTTLAERLGVSQPTISRVLRGVQVPAEPLVRAVDALYLECGSPVADHASSANASESASDRAA